MKEVLEANGWVMYYQCQCGGQKQYFTNKNKQGYEVRVRVKNMTFSILLQNQVIGGPFWGYQLEEKLNKYIN